MAADNSKMFFLSLLEAVIFSIVAALEITHLLANYGTRLCGISSKRPGQQKYLETWRLVLGWLTEVSSRLTMDLILFIDTCQGYIPKWETYGSLVCP